METNLEWNVYRYNINTRKIEVINVFDHSSFYEEFKRISLKTVNREEFSKEMDRIAMYYFWCKYEHEVVISEYTDREPRAEMKIDIYDQLKLNWDAFIDHVLWSVGD